MRGIYLFMLFMRMAMRPLSLGSHDLHSRDVLVAIWPRPFVVHVAHVLPVVNSFKRQLALARFLKPKSM